MSAAALGAYCPEIDVSMDWLVSYRLSKTQVLTSAVFRRHTVSCHVTLATRVSQRTQMGERGEGEMKGEREEGEEGEGGRDGEREGEG